MTEIRVLAGGRFRRTPLRASRAPRVGAGVYLTPREIRGVVRKAAPLVVKVKHPRTSRALEFERSGHHLVANLDAADALPEPVVCFVTAPKSHVLDGDEGGVEEALRVCMDTGLETTRAGLGLVSAARINYGRVRRSDLAVVNLTEGEFCCAGAGLGAKPFDVIAANRAVSQARCRAEHAPVILHGGLESLHFPIPKSVRALRFRSSPESCVEAIFRETT